MGQEEVIKFLEKQKNPLSSGEIASAMNENKNKISVIISKLLKHGEINYIEINRLKALDNYGCKRRMKLYYIG